MRLKLEDLGCCKWEIRHSQGSRLIAFLHRHEEILLGVRQKNLADVIARANLLKVWKPRLAQLRQHFLLRTLLSNNVLQPVDVLVGCGDVDVFTGLCREDGGNGVEVELEDVELALLLLVVVKLPLIHVPVETSRDELVVVPIPEDTLDL